MADSFDLNNQSRAADAAPALPTSDSEVSIRTMASDIELMGQSGGMIGQSAQGVQVPVTLHPEGEPGQQAGSSSSNGLKTIVIVIVVIAAALALFALGYFVIGR